MSLKRVSPGSPHLEGDEGLRVLHSFTLFLGLVSPARPLPRMAIPMLSDVIAYVRPDCGQWCYNDNEVRTTLASRWTDPFTSHGDHLRAGTE